MYTFSELLRKIREKADLTQEELAKTLGVSTVLITMIETGKKDVSKSFVTKLADRLDVYPSSIVPFVFTDSNRVQVKPSGIEKALINLGEKLQMHLIVVKSKKLKRYVQG